MSQFEKIATKRAISLIDRHYELSEQIADLSREKRYIRKQLRESVLRYVMDSIYSTGDMPPTPTTYGKVQDDILMSIRRAMDSLCEFTKWEDLVRRLTTGTSGDFDLMMCNYECELKKLKIYRRTRVID